MNEFLPLPADVDFPELDEQSKAIADALHAKMKADTQRMRDQPRRSGVRYATARDVWQKTHPGTEPPVRRHNPEALKQLTPYQRAVYRYIFTRED